MIYVLIICKVHRVTAEFIAFVKKIILRETELLTAGLPTMGFLNCTQRTHRVRRSTRTICCRRLVFVFVYWMTSTSRFNLNVLTGPSTPFVRRIVNIVSADRRPALPRRQTKQFVSCLYQLKVTLWIWRFEGCLCSESPSFCGHLWAKFFP